MPFRPQQSLLKVEADNIHSIDTTSVENLFGMWSLFSKTSHAMDEGYRLENLSWRLWNRETFCCASKSKARSNLSPRERVPGKPKAATTDIPMPELSSSCDSATSEEMDEEKTVIPKARPEIKCVKTCDSTQPTERHITPVVLQNIVKSFEATKEVKEPLRDLLMPTPSFTPADPPSNTGSRDLSNLHLSSSSATTKASQTTTPQASSVTPSHATFLESSASTVDTNDDQASQTVGSESSSNTEMSTHSIVRGFVPGGAPSSYRSQTHLNTQPTPILKTSPGFHTAKPKKKGPMFTIGTSSGEDESSLDSHMYKSSLSENLMRNSNVSAGSRKQTSFKDEVAIARAAEHSPVFESDDEDGEVSESAIEDEDDSSDWEDSEDPQSGPSSVNEKELFQRVDSRPNLTSRRSLLTTQLHEPDRAKALANAASRSTPAIRHSRRSTPNGPSAATSPEPNAQLQVPTQEYTRARPIIMTTSNTHSGQLALSPRTTRRNMLSTELTESLRKNLLWERQHRSTGNLAAMKRRHTSMDVKNLRQHPEPGPVLPHQDNRQRFTNEYFNAGLQEYHVKGW
ncbi:hypothetical protein LTR37_009606 [Vermiconidia calcicola]|uniref:Uncharacterized protein n=1 Tax=Vermiconidia calcicola TaxID=1690605 RepID=A0ACC3N784_9PEZI|nr:hypothetical protein LTR37_009606 [Vermiconidia calcicola]